MEAQETLDPPVKKMSVGLPDMPKQAKPTVVRGLPDMPKKASGASSPHDFTHGYKPTPEDLKTKQGWTDLQNGLGKSGGGANHSPATDLYHTDKKLFVDNVLKNHKDIDWVKRLYEQNAPSTQVKGESNHSTHLMADDGKGYVYPTIIRQNGKLIHLTEDQAYDYAKKTNTGIQLPKEQGSWFAANGYKLGTGVNNDIDPNGHPRNNPNLILNNKGEMVEGSKHSKNTPANKGSWSNLPTFGAREVFGGLEKDLGNLFGFAKDKLSPVLPGASKAMGAVQDWWGKAQKEDEQVSSTHQLPNTTIGHVATTATKFIPDIIELAATPELNIAKLGKLGVYAAKLGKVGTKAATMAVGKFPIQQATKTMLQHYSDARDKGMTEGQANLEALKGFGEGYKNGVIFEGAGEAAGKLTKLGTEALEKVGLMSGKKLIAGAEKRVLHSMAQGITFSAAPIVQNAVEGKGTNLNEIKQNGIFGAVLGGISNYHGDAATTPADEAAAQVLMRKPLIDLHNFHNADIEDIKNIHNSDISAPDLQAQSAAHAENGFKADDPDEKSKEIVQSSLYGNASSIKHVTDAILKDKQGVIDEVNQLPLSDEAKQPIVDKINEVHKALDPVEQQKTELANKIKALQDEPASGDIIKDKENKVRLQDLNKQLDDIVKKQYEGGKDKETAGADESTENLQITNQQNNEKEKNEGRSDLEQQPGVVEDGGSQSNQNKEPHAERNREAGGEGWKGQEKEGYALSVSGEGKTEPETTIGDQIKKHFGNVNEYTKPEGSKFAGKKEWDATDENGYKISVKPNADGYEVFLGRPGKDVGNVNSFNQIESWFPESEDELRKSIDDAKKIVDKAQKRSQETKEPPEEKTTGIKKAITESTRAERNLPEVKLSKIGDDSEVLHRGKKAVDEGKIKPQEVAQRVVDNDGIYTPEEAGAMLYYGHQLDRHENVLREALSQTESDSPEHTTVLSNLNQLNDKVDLFTQANRIHSRNWGNVGNIMQIEADKSFSPANIRAIIKENHGGKIPKEVEERIKKAEDERDKAIADLKKANENQITKKGDDVIKKMRGSIKIIKQTKAELEHEAEDLLKDLRKALKEDFGRLNAGIPLPTETLAVLGKLAVNYFKQGVKDFEGLANKIYDDLKDTGIEKNQVREYLSTYEPLRDESRERRIGLLERKERSLNKQLETGKIRDYSRKPEIVFKKTSEVLKAEQRVADAEYKLKQEKFKSYTSDQSGIQRAFNRIIRWRRRIALANPLTSLKLISAAVSSPVMRIQKQVVGLGIGKIIPSIAKKAPIESGLNAKAEFDYWQDVFNPKTFVKDAAEIYKSGESPLKKKFSKFETEHYPGLDALQDTHMVIKAPVHRAAFNATMKYLYDWASKNDIDYTDPLIVKNFENAAIKRANYEIFQEDIKLGKRIQALLGSGPDMSSVFNDGVKESNLNAARRFLVRFMLPINLVPLNIARRVESHTFGLMSGSYRAIEAYRKGIDNLTPEQADYIMLQLKNGSVGLAYYTLGLFASRAVLGGLWQKDDKEAKKPLPNRTAYNEMRVNGVNVDKRLQHGMPLFLMQEGATTSRVYNHYMDVPDDDPAYIKVLKSTAKAMMATQGAIAEEVPMIGTPSHLVQGLSDPYEREKAGQDLKRAVGFSLLKDLHITKQDIETPLDKKLKTVTKNGEKVQLNKSQIKQRKAYMDDFLNSHTDELTKGFNAEYRLDIKQQNERKVKNTYWKTIGRSNDYIREKFDNAHDTKLAEYLNGVALDYSEAKMKIEMSKEKREKNTADPLNVRNK